MSSISENQKSGDLKDEFEISRRDTGRIRPGRKKGTNSVFAKA